MNLGRLARCLIGFGATTLVGGLVDAHWGCVEAQGRLETLPSALREMARWRSAYPELNLAELALRMKLSKSAVNHRLRRLQELGAAAEPPADHARRSA